jgi:hypothetical protein
MHGSLSWISLLYAKGARDMNRIPLSIPEVGLIAGTRAALGAGVALLLADRLNIDQRRAVGWTLLAVGALTTVPIAVQFLRSRRPEEQDSQRDWATHRLSQQAVEG